MKKLKFTILALFITINYTMYAQTLQGSYTIGSGGNYTTIASAMSALTTNGISGNVTFNILSGTYTAANLDFSSGIPNQGSNDTITFISNSKSANDVSITSNGTALTLNNVKNLVIKNITLNAVNGTKGVEITGTCNNLLIDSCIILASTTGYSSSQSGIYRANSSSSTNTIIISNNTIKGGYYGIYLYGTNYNNYAPNITIKNNIVSETYQGGIYCYYLSLNSFSNNSITARTIDYSSTFYGCYVTYCNASVIEKNNIRITNQNITYPYGMICQYLNYRNTTTPGLICNNQIIVYTRYNYYGMYITYSRANIFHNSVFMGGNGVARALYISASAGLPINIRNNNLHLLNPSAYPIYIYNGVDYLGQTLKMDYNNYYNQSYVGFAGSDAATLEDWHFITGQDIHSVSTYPNYPNIASFSLETDGIGLICPRINSVMNDKQDTLRQAITTMGAYHDYIPPTYDIRILNLISPSHDITAGINSPIKITIMNMGATAIDSINIYYKVNGTLKNYLWTGTPLAMGDSTSVITLDNFIPMAGENTISIYTSLLNGQSDINPLNDTVHINPFGCKSIINSVYTVGGSSADFSTISEALDVISYCGVSTPTIISINPGVYNENIIIPSIHGTSEANTLTITSANGDSSSVIIQSSSSTPVITLSNTNNIIIKNITVKNNASGTNSIGIRLQNSNKNISIQNNHLEVSKNTPSTTTSTDIMTIISETSLDTNLFILNNNIVGSGGIYIYSSGTSSSTYNININNNNLQRIIYYGIYCRYSRVAEIKNNKILQDPMVAIFGGGNGYGLYVYYSYGVSNTITDISNNIIRGDFGYFSYFYGCYSNNGTNTNVLFTNNALIKVGSGNVTNMFYINSGQWQCIHNTFVNVGEGQISNIARVENTSTNLNFSNNILTQLNSNCTCAYLVYFNVSGSYTLDYNNYYNTNGNIAYQGTTYSTLSGWKTAYPQNNQHSQNANPLFIDSMNFVKPTYWASIMCNRNDYVKSDILGNPRAKATFMGCYEPLFTNDAGLTTFISPTATATAGDTTDIIVELVNYGTNTLNTITLFYSINGVTQSPILLSNLGLNKHQDTSILIGYFIPILNNITQLKVWCSNPNSTSDQHTYNDTISTSTSGCSMVLNGHYTIGNVAGADFPTIASALTAVRNCGISGPVVFELLSGNYTGFSLDTIFIGSSITNTITFTSSAQNADSVIILPYNSTYSIELKKTKYINFSHLTLNAQSGTNGILFSDTCSYIDIRNCIIKSDPTTTSSSHVGINKSSNSFSLYNINIINNLINGGYSNINLTGGSGTTGNSKNIRIDGNTLSNAYLNGIYLTYAHLSSISNNIITSRTSNAGNIYYGIYCKDTIEVDTIGNNKINATKSSTTTYSYGIYCYHVNYYSNTSATAHIFNNEIILNSSYDGISAYYTRSNICHNSIYITGNGASDGIYIYTTSTTPVKVMNNNSVNLSSSGNATAIYIGTSALTDITLDYNNYYSTQGTPCQLGSPFYTLKSWQTTTGQDQHSLNILPTYINISVDLRINSNELICPRNNQVSYDLYGIPRKKLTNMGAYHTFSPLSFDIAPLSIISPTEDVSNFISVPVRITVYNLGDSSISSFDINWSVNGIQQPTYHWTGTPLSMGDSTLPILIDYFTPSMGFNNFTFYISNPNGKSDQNHNNDTISIITFACGSELSGIYTIGGDSADFSSINTALRVLNSCGVNGDIVFKINSGVYFEDINLTTPFMDLNSPYTVTFTSTADHMDSVIIKSNGTAVTLANNNNVIFTKLTFDVTSGTTGIDFTNSCSNIEISYCKILLSPTTTSSSAIGIYKANNTGVIDSVTIKNNIIDGGYYGIYMYAGQYLSTYILGSKLIIDSNIISNAYYCGAYLYYGDFNSISGNYISSRSSNPYTYYYGLRLAYTNANITENKIHTLNTISYFNGIYLYYYFNYFSTNAGLIANNEIIYNSSSTSSGIYTSYYTRANIINNSILSKGSSSCRGIYIGYLQSGYNITVKNNNLVNESSGYPIYLAYNSSDLSLDYNNYYAPTYIGYYSQSYTSLSSWKTAVGKDANSVKINPSFINTSINLDLNSSSGLNCVRDINVLKDIKGFNRKNPTTIGAYEVLPELSVSGIIEPTYASTHCSQELTDISIEISNLKTNNINLSTEPVNLHVKITGAVNYQKDTVLSSGIILGSQKDTFIIIKNFQLNTPGTYNITAFIDNIDRNPLNDTTNSYFTVNPSYNHYDTITICDNDLPINYGDSSFAAGTKTGNYPVHYTLSTGCDSLITLALIVNPTYHHYKTVSICDNELPYTYGDSIFPVGTASGTYPVHYTLPTGCDSLITLTLNVNPTYHHYKTVTICDNELPYTYGDTLFPVGTKSGVYPIHFTLPTGCDSLITLTLNVNPTYHHYDIITICDNDLPITYGDSSFAVGTKTGNYPIHYTLPTGCDSLITLTLIVNPTYHHYKTVIICDNELPYTYGDSIFPIGTASGTYPVHYTLPTGCDSLITLTLIVNPTYHHYKTLTICDNELPYNFRDTIFFDTAGIYSINLTSVNGCDSLITLTLNVNPTYHHYKTLSICDNELPYTYGDSIFPIGTASGTYPVHYTLPTGCDSLITLNLIINPTYHHFDTITICANDLPITYGDSVFGLGTTSGNYPIYFTLPTGCDSLITLTLIVHPAYHHYKTVSICDNELPYSYGDSIFPIGTSSGNYPIHYTLPTGCDSLITLNLIVNPTYSHQDTLSICNNDLPLTYGDSIFPTGTLSGNYTIHFTLPTGCDSLVTLNLIVNPVFNYPDTLVICNRDLPYSYGDSILNAAGNYTIGFTSVNGCDSIIHLSLLVYSCDGTEIVNICHSDLPYTYHDSIFYQGGIYLVKLTSQYGLDSIVALTLKEHPSYTVYDTVSICLNELPFIYGDTTFLSAGNHNITRTTIFGCDSSIHLTLIVNPLFNQYDTISICDSDLPLTYGDSTFFASGNYIVYFHSSANCDSIINLTLNVYPTYNNIDTLSICDNQLPFYYGDSLFPIGTISGNYPIHFNSAFGCDSLITLTLNVNPTYHHYDTITICDNDLPITYGDSSFAVGTITGNYPIHYTLPTGCDSLITLSLIVNPTYHHYKTVSICDNELPYTYGDSIFLIGTASGTYQVHYTLPTGCDSLIMLNLKVSPTYNHFDTLSIRNIDLPITYGDSLFQIGTVSGDYTVIFKSINGCDSTINLHLTVNTSSFASDTLSICDSDLPITYGDSIFPVGTTTGFYQIVYSLPNGGDSTVTLLLFVNSTYNLFDTFSICDSDLPFQYGDSIFPIATLSGDYPVLFTSYYGCDSLINLHLNVNPTYLIYDTLSICENELPYTYTDTIFNIGTISGTYNFCRQSIYGCDSITLLFLTVNPVYNFTDTHTLCESELPFSYAGQSFDSAGNYSINLLSQFGCDSNILLTIYIQPAFTETNHIRICESELPFSFAGQKFDKEGVYHINLKTEKGCDSLITLLLVVKNIPTQPDSIFGNPKINSIGQYIFSIDPVEDANTYIWNLSNKEWIGKSTTNVISVFIPKPGEGIISVKAANQCGESEKTELHIFFSTGIENHELQSEIAIYPNPALDHFYLDLKAIQGKTKIQISDISGKTLYVSEFNIYDKANVLKFDVSNYPKGFYFITIHNNDQRMVKKIIIE